MTQDATQVRVGITGALYLGALGVTAPTATAGSWPGGWVDLGLLDEAKPAEMHPTQTTKDFYAWQTRLPVRTIQTQTGLEWVFTLLQKTGTNLKLAFGGGSITSLGGGDYKYTLPVAGINDEHAFGLEVTDGTVTDRWVLPRGLVSTRQPILFKRDEMVKFDLTVKALAPSGAPSGNWDLLVSNDPALAS
jgi:hypothetical protein